jgi:hypothetical protein
MGGLTATRIAQTSSFLFAQLASCSALLGVGELYEPNDPLKCPIVVLLSWKSAITSSDGIGSAPPLFPRPDLALVRPIMRGINDGQPPVPILALGDSNVRSVEFLRGSEAGGNGMEATSNW